jgi:hypothetical protein
VGKPFHIISMRKFIVSSLAVVALAGGGFAVNTLLNTQIIQAQPPIDDPGDEEFGGRFGQKSWCYRNGKWISCCFQMSNPNC